MGWGARILIFLTLFWGAWTAEVSAAPIPKRYRLGFQTGLAYQIYNEIHPLQNTRGARDLRQTLLTLQFDYFYYLFSDVVIVGFRGFYTPMALATNSTAGKSLSLMNAAAQLGLELPILPRPWILCLMAGGFYNTTFSSSAYLGYQNITGPEFYPTLRWVSEASGSAGFSADLYYKFSPVMSVGGFTVANRVWSAGANLRIPVSGRFKYPEYAFQRALVVGVEYSDLYYDFQLIRNVRMSSQLLKLTAGVEF